jgi:arsenate reductase (glutaredoxin)
MKIYLYSCCSTCRSAVKFLDRLNIPYTKVEITENPPFIEELVVMLEHYNGDIKKLFNTSGQIYREMNLKEKLPTMPKEKAIQLLTSNGMLIKRPFLLTEEVGLVGFKEELWKKSLPSAQPCK